MRESERSINLFLVRHGETAWNARRLFIGQADPPLNGRGWQQTLKSLAGLRQHVNGAGPVIISSDLVRARQTATLIGTVTHVSRLWRELDFGSWTGKTYKQLLESQEGPRLYAWYDDPWAVSPPGGETLLELMIRVRRGVEEALRFVKQGPRAATLIIVSHGGPIRAFEALLQGRPRDLAAYWDTSIGSAEFIHHDTSTHELNEVARGKNRSNAGEPE